MPRFTKDVLDAMNKTKLKDLCKELRIKFDARDIKDDLIQKIMSVATIDEDEVFVVEPEPIVEPVIVLEVAEKETIYKHVECSCGFVHKCDKCPDCGKVR